MTAAHLNLIAGTWSPARSGETFASVAASGGEELARLPRSLAVDVDDVVLAARGACAVWERTGHEERAAILARCSRAVGDAAAKLREVVRREAGYGPEDAAREVDAAVSAWERAAAAPPAGVAAVVTSWHRPVSLPCRMLSSALAAGSAAIFKPSEDAALSGALVAAAIAPHLPPGVLGVVHGTGEEAGSPLIDHPDVDAIFFAGSREVERTLRRRCAAAGKVFTAEVVAERAEGVEIT